MKHIVIYRPHGKLIMETKYYGPFESWEDADDFLGTLPAIGYQFTQEEIDLIATDPDTLTPEMRRQRGYALRRKILQNPDSPTARQLEALRLATERGEITPQLPNKSGDSGLVLHARTPSPAPPEAKAPAPKTSPRRVIMSVILSALSCLMGSRSPLGAKGSRFPPACHAPKPGAGKPAPSLSASGTKRNLPPPPRAKGFPSPPTVPAPPVARRSAWAG